MPKENEIENVDDKEEELIAVEEEPEKGELKEDDKEEIEDEEELEEEEEERLGAGEEHEDRDELRARRRDERKTRRQRQKEARERDRKEMDFLRTRNEQLERRQSEVEARVGQSEVSQVDTRINQIKGQIKLADQVMSKAMAAQKGDDFVEAQNIRDGLRDQLAQLNIAKQSMSERAPAAGAPDPRLLSRAEVWIGEHDWWDPNGGDSDSRAVSTLDNALVNEGYDPTTDEYWKELTARVKRRLPHRFVSKADDEETETGKRKKNSGGPAFRTGGRERPLKPNEVYISPDRKEAMIEAGVWDDPELRQRYLKQYADYDRQQQA